MALTTLCSYGCRCGAMGFHVDLPDSTSTGVGVQDKTVQKPRSRVSVMIEFATDNVRFVV